MCQRGQWCFKCVPQNSFTTSLIPEATFECRLVRLKAMKARRTGLHSRFFHFCVGSLVEEFGPLSFPPPAPARLSPFPLRFMVAARNFHEMLAPYLEPSGIQNHKEMCFCSLWFTLPPALATAALPRPGQWLSKNLKDCCSVSSGYHLANLNAIIPSHYVTKTLGRTAHFMSSCLGH